MAYRISGTMLGTGACFFCWGWCSEPVSQGLIGDLDLDLEFQDFHPEILDIGHEHSWIETGLGRTHRCCVVRADVEDGIKISAFLHQVAVEAVDESFLLQLDPAGHVLGTLDQSLIAGTTCHLLNEFLHVCFVFGLFVDSSRTHRI